MNVQIYKCVRGLISTRFQIPMEALTATTRLVEDLKLDNVDMMAVAIDLETTFGVGIPQASVESMRTIEDAATLVENGNFLER